METVIRMLAWVSIVCLVVCSTEARPLKKGARKGANHQKPEPTNQHKNQATNLHRMSIVGVPTNRRRVRLFNKNGFFLKISNEGKPRGTRSFRNPNSKYELFVAQWTGENNRI